jgi:hypothetical protein
MRRCVSAYVVEVRRFYRLAFDAYSAALLDAARIDALVRGSRTKSA